MVNRINLELRKRAEEGYKGCVYLVEGVSYNVLLKVMDAFREAGWKVRHETGDVREPQNDLILSVD